MNVVLTCLLTTQIDPQRKVKWDPEPSVLDAWANSIRGAEAVVLADELKVHPSARVEAAPPIRLNVYHARWHLYRRWLASERGVGKVFITDGSDVVMLREPWPDMDSETLYLGSEGEKLGCPWMLRHHHSRGMKEWIRGNSDRVLLNAGLVGGNREVVLDFLSDLCRTLTLFPDDNDMGPLNYTAYSDKWAGRWETGARVHTEFRAFQDNGQAWWSHK